MLILDTERVLQVFEYWTTGSRVRGFADINRAPKIQHNNALINNKDTIVDLLIKMLLYITNWNNLSFLDRY
ncbi:hypothetical protein CWC03_03715 [Pseudoalteromonas sp. S2755]|nr:hypothetical protein CWC03_03715 [Pseudoalteromonas sp. S2755]